MKESEVVWRSSPKNTNVQNVSRRFRSCIRIIPMPFSVTDAATRFTGTRQQKKSRQIRSDPKWRTNPGRTTNGNSESKRSRTPHPDLPVWSLSSVWRWLSHPFFLFFRDVRISDYTFAAMSPNGTVTPELSRVCSAHQEVLANFSGMHFIFRARLIHYGTVLG